MADYSSNTFVDYATIAGGVAGFASFVYVLYEKITTRPKIKSAVRECKIQFNRNGNKIEGRDISVVLEVGNVGKEATTITQVQLRMKSGELLDSKSVTASTNPKFGVLRFVVDDHSARMCEPGYAFIERFRFFSKNYDLHSKDSEGDVLLRLLGGKVHRQKVVFSDNGPSD